MMKTDAPSLIRLEQIEQLEIDQVWQHYRQYVNPGQVELISSFGFGQELIASAAGCLLETQSGKQILDFTGGIGVLNHGHNHPRILAARQQFQQQQRMEVHKNYFSPYLAALSHNIAQLLPGDLNISYFSNSGAEAVEGAIKMAFKAHQGKRRMILHSDISYHGKLLGAGSVSSSRELHFRFPEIPGCHAFEYDNLASVDALLEQLKQADGNSDIYAIIVEPMSASSLRQCSPAFLQGLRQRCDQLDIALIFDEVFTGWGKTGELFHFLRHELLPDILITSKALGGGKASIAGYVAREQLFKQAYGRLADTTLHSTTYNGFGEECVTAIEAINVLIDDDYVGRARQIHRQLNNGLNALQAEYPHIVKEVRGVGALNGVLLATGPEFLSKLSQMVPGSFFQDDRFLQKLVTASVINALYNEHQILTYYGENQEILLMAAPSIVVDDHQIAHFIDGLRQCFGQGLLLLCGKFIRSKLFSKFLNTAKPA